MGDPTTRALQLLSLLQTRASWSAPELAERSGTTTRTIRRDVERLRELGYPVVATRGPEGGYSLGPGGRLPPLMLGQDEAIAVAVALRLAARANLAGLEEPALRALGKLDPVLSAPARAAIRAVTEATDHLGQPTEGPAASVDDLVTLAGAIRERVRVRFGYRDFRGTATDRDVEPHRLAARYGRWFLFAHDRDRDDWRLFRLDRLADLRATTFMFTPREVPDLAARLDQAPAYQGAIAAGATFDVPADRLQRRIPPRYGRVEAIGRSSSRLHCSADRISWLAVELMWAAYDLGTTVRKVEPPELAAALRGLAVAAGRPEVGSE